MEPDVRERFERLEGIVASLVEVARSQVEISRSHENRMDHIDARLDRLSLAQQESHEELTVLIRMMDEWIKRNPGNGTARPGN